MPTSSKPQLACSARGRRRASMRAITAWNPEPWRSRRGRAAPCRCPPLGCRVDVDRVLDGRAVGGRSLYGESEAKPTTVPSVVDGDDGGERPGAASQPRCCSSRSGTRSNVLVVVRHLEVVDRADRLGVAELGRRTLIGATAGEGSGAAPQVRCVDRCGPPMASRGLRPAGRRGASRRKALLAQSAEHSHGKAGVVGSIPTEGSTMRPASPGRRARQPGGVAQLVRASGS